MTDVEYLTLFGRITDEVIEELLCKEWEMNEECSDSLTVIDDDVDSCVAFGTTMV